ncbi:endonuclease/exonuclease/phosphatase family protein [Levilactobacillus enshiensis]|uniref:endonuclease/exonuclease/phosphatase family protein n=1 Tax=Levilactobacillus enshiensis TaxID=2590213 RepID=UPI00117B9873|nr:endonuclease/exonuclease/phosphatase family protein [Levilactobacillus enshiensis]
MLRENDISSELRTVRIINTIKSIRPDIIYFTEEDPVIFSLISCALLNDYVFYYPQGFNRCWYAAVVVAVRKSVNRHNRLEGAKDGTGIVSKSAKWMSLKLDSLTVLGVHFPQPSNPTYEDFFRQVVEFGEGDTSTSVIIGDFNPEQATSVRLPNFRSALPEGSTSMFGTQLDYVFIRKGRAYQHVFIDDSCMVKGENLFSDHAIIGVEL